MNDAAFAPYDSAFIHETLVDLFEVRHGKIVREVEG